MKKLIVFISVIACVAIMFVGSLPLVLSTGAVQQRILSHFQELTGRSVTFRGVPSISFNPFLGIELSDFVIAERAGEDNEQPLLEVERVTGSLSLLPALFGRVEVKEYRLYRPVLNLRQGQDGTPSWTFERGRMRDAFDSTITGLLEKANALPVSVILGRLDILDGTINYQDDIAGTQERFSGVNVDLLWPDTNSAISASGAAVWRNENISVSLNAKSPMLLFAGGDTPISGRFNSEPVSFDFDGEARLLPDLFLKGKVEARSPSISRLSQAIDVNIGKANILGDWIAAGDLEATINSAILSNAMVSINGANSTGVVRVATNELGVLKLDGTLAFDTIDISSYLTGPQSQALEFVRQEHTSDIDLDLRISANRFTAGKVVLEGLASAITSSSDYWKIDIGDARTMGGSISAQVQSVRADETNTLHLKFSALDVNASELQAVFGTQKASISGTARMNADLRSAIPADNPNALNVNGAVEFEIMEGSVLGFDLRSLISSIRDDTGLTYQRPGKGASTPFQRLDVKLFMNNSNATLSKANLSLSPDRNIQIFGNADFRSGAIAMRAQETTDNGPKPERLVIGGTLKSPFISLTIDPNAKPREAPSGDDKQAEIKG